MKFSLIFLVLTSITSAANAQLFKVSDRGTILKDTSSEQSCVLDDRSKLVWEVKLATKGLQNAQNTYTWFNTQSGVQNGDYSHNCHWSESCNTQAYVQALKDIKLCQQSNWRLPTQAELKTLLIYGDNDLLINPKFFPNTQLKSYWSSDELSTNIAIDVPFYYGGSQGSDKSFDAYVRLVSDAN